MTSVSKRLGYAAEAAVTAWLKTAGWIYAERRQAGAANDTGDIAGLPGVVIEVKNHKTIKLADWVEQLAEEMDNADATTGTVIAKRRGKGDVGEWYAIQPVKVWADLMKQAGY